MGFQYVKERIEFSKKLIGSKKGHFCYIFFYDTVKIYLLKPMVMVCGRILCNICTKKNTVFGRDYKRVKNVHNVGNFIYRF